MNRLERTCADPSYSYRIRNGGFVITSDWPILLEEGWVTVPKGFACDLASVPRPFRVLPGFEPYELGCGSILHDWSYRNGGYVSPEIQLTRRRTDQVFLRLMKADGVGWQAGVAFWAVRLFGFLAWRRLTRSPFTLHAV